MPLNLDDCMTSFCVAMIQVVEMMGTDLLRQQQKWKDSLMEIRQIMAKLVEQVCY
jgi:hypothetical protein